MSEPQVFVRTANLEDSERLFAWRNHPTTRAMFLGGEEVPLQSHLTWLRRTLADPGRVLLIGEWQDLPFGQIRFDIQGKEVQVSITIDPERRRGGLGIRLIEAGLQWLCSRHQVSTILAVIKPDNLASRKAFGRCGFVRRDLTVVDGMPVERWYRSGSSDQEDPPQSRRQWRSR